MRVPLLKRLGQSLKETTRVIKQADESITYVARSLRSSGCRDAELNGFDAVIVAEENANFFTASGCLIKGGQARCSYLYFR
jgi:hypothetical protein